MKPITMMMIAALGVFTALAEETVVATATYGALVDLDTRKASVRPLDGELLPFTYGAGETIRVTPMMGEADDPSGWTKLGEAVSLAVSDEGGTVVWQVPGNGGSCYLAELMAGGTVKASACFSYGVRGSVAIAGALAPKIGGELSVDVSFVEGAGYVGEPSVKWYIYPSGGRWFDVEPVEGETYTPTKADCEKWIQVAVYDDHGMLGLSEPIWFSKLPVMYIDVENGQTVISKTIDYNAVMRLQGNAEWTKDKVLYNGDMTMHVRGNSTADTDKKPYKLKLDSKTDLLGMGKNKHWVLLSNPYDFSLMRNKIFYDLAAQMGMTAMDSTWVDVVMNGEYMGNYQLCEHIRIGETRVDIFDWEGEAETVAKAVYAVESANGMTKDDRDEMNTWLEQNLGWMTDGAFTYNGRNYVLDDYGVDTNAYDTTNGYIFELDNFYDEVSKYYVGAGRLNMPVMINRPEFLYTNQRLMDYTKSMWDGYWEACVSPDGYNSDRHHYTELSDLDSMVSFWLTMVISANVESDGWSRYAFIGDNGLITWGPVWDFDNSCGGRTIEAQFAEDGNGRAISVTRNQTYSTGWNVACYQGYSRSQATCFYPEWSDDPYFCMKLYEKFNEIGGYLDELVASGGIIDGYYDYLLESGVANAERWAGKVFDTSRGFFVSKHVSFDGEFSEVTWFKDVLKSRIIWMRDRMKSVVATIDELARYGSNPCLVNPSAFNIAIEGGVPRFDAGKALATDVMIAEGGDLAMTVSSSGAAAIEVSVNGGEAIPFATSEVTVPSATLDSAAGERNMIAVVAKDGSGNALATTYVFVTAVDANLLPHTLTSGAVAADLDTREVTDGVRRPATLDEVLPFAWAGDSAWTLGGTDEATVTLSAVYKGEVREKQLAHGFGEGVKRLKNVPRAVVTNTLLHADNSTETAIFDFSATEGAVGLGGFLGGGYSVILR